VDDYALAPSYHAVITRSIQEQLSDYRAHAADDSTTTIITATATAGTSSSIVGSHDEEDTRWWAAWRKKQARDMAAEAAAALETEAEQDTPSTSGKRRSKKRRKVARNSFPAAAAKKLKEKEDGGTEADMEGEGGEDGFSSFDIGTPRRADELELGVDENQLRDDVRILVKVGVFCCFSFGGNLLVCICMMSLIIGSFSLSAA
jgi:hypothetical protein